MMQGDCYGIPVELKQADGTVVLDTDVLDVEITIGHLSKTFAKKQVVYDTNNQKWVFPITQDESFKFPASTVKGQVRVVWPGGIVEGHPLGYIDVEESQSKEVL